MPSTKDNQGGSYGVQQPKRKRKFHSAHHQWRKQQRDSIMKTNKDNASDTHQTSLWAMVNQAQQEWQNVKGSQDCQSPSTSFNSAQSNRIAIKVPSSPSLCVGGGGPPSNPYVGSIEMPTAVALMTSHDLQPCTNTKTTQNDCVGQTPKLFFGRLDSSINSLRSTMRLAAATFEGIPSIFRKKKREHFSAEGSGEDDTYGHIDKLHVGALQPELLSLFPLDPDLKTVKENSRSNQISLSALKLTRETGSQLLGLCGCSLALSRDGERCVREDTTAQDTFEGPPILSIDSSEGTSQEFIDSSCHQSSSGPHLNPNVTWLSRNGQWLDSARKPDTSNSWPVYMDKGPSISAVEMSNGSTSASAASSREVYRIVSPSTLATPPSAASKKVSPFSCATPSTEALEKISPSCSATASEQINTPALGTPLQQKIRSSNGTKPHSNQNTGTPNQEKLHYNQTTRPSIPVTRLSDPDTRLKVPEGGIKSSFKGVGYFKRTKRWEAHIWNTEESKQEYLGAFSTEEQAARAYDRATLYFRGAGAKLHFKLKDYAEELPRLEALTKGQLTTMLKKQSKGSGSLNPAYPV